VAADHEKGVSLLFWLVPLCTLGGALAGWLCAPLAATYFERPIRWARPGITVTMAVVAGLFAWRFAGRAELPAYLYFAVVGSLLAFIDIAVKRLPNPFTLPSYLVGLALLGGATLVGGHPIRLEHAVAGLVALWALYALQHLFAPGAIGWGDVKLSGVLGLYLGWLGAAAVAAGLLGAFVLAALAGLGLIAAGRATRKTQIPFGPFMLASAVAVIAASGLVPALAR
jgi:prepilin signal peptidase PulO-like enzyme (type II secretory pathway)